MTMKLGKWLCAFVRARGGRHRWINGKCSRCGRKQPKARAAKGPA